MVVIMVITIVIVIIIIIILIIDQEATVITPVGSQTVQQ
jgi:hypothetical protein